MFNHERLHLPLAWQLGTVTVPVGDFAIVALEERPAAVYLQERTLGKVMSELR